MRYPQWLASLAGKRRRRIANEVGVKNRGTSEITFSIGHAGIRRRISAQARSPAIASDCSRVSPSVGYSSIA